mmetsp:Transcript_14463/g.45468  ORF Transcript_14463/g.45468 Transcript_14463/m.45468 type:complete len:236 (+) Transcript_14463:523-1230(+)
MVKEGEGDEPKVHAQVGNEVVCTHGPPAGDLDPASEQQTHADKAKVRQDDHGSLRILKDGRLGLKVVGTAATKGLARKVEQEVARPADGPHEHDAHKGAEGGLVECLGNRRVLRCVLLVVCGVRHKHLVAVKVVGGSVVLGMRELPRKVGDEQRRVHDEANNVVDSLGGREGTMACLMTKHPQARAGGALGDPVGDPSETTHGRVWNGGDEGHSNPPNDCTNCSAHCQVRKRRHI